ncbi:leukocyte immunoglobulin-like receptor subfamily B member 3A isoform X6 [Dipodomys merriami]|uniref:leukocyte immunoglobulin-like receptor subfamily B member 3A isoform X6 n=1 Tax=Dipodomys merriami TaxID=94247 RepID=UPI0038558C9D
MKSDGDSIWGIPTYREPSPQKQEPGSWVGISPFGVTVGVASLGAEGKSHILCLCSQMPRLLRRHRRHCAHSMALTLAALLYLGLSVDSAAQDQGGSLPRPVLRAEPCSVVAQGSTVTLWCEGAWQAKEFRLQKERHSVQWFTKTLETWGNRTSFSIQSMKKDDAGRYFCVYLSPVGWSDHSEPLELVVTDLPGCFHPPPKWNMPTAGPVEQTLTPKEVGPKRVRTKAGIQRLGQGLWSQCLGTEACFGAPAQLLLSRKKYCMRMLLRRTQSPRMGWSWTAGLLPMRTPRM